MIDPFSIFVIVVVVLAVALVFMGVKTVPQGFEFTVERFGRYNPDADAGAASDRPAGGPDRPAAERDGTGHRRPPRRRSFTRDNAMVKVDGVVFFQVLDPVKASYEVRRLEVSILNLTMTNIRTVMGSMDLDELLVPARQDQRRPAQGGRRGGPRPGG